MVSYTYPTDVVESMTPNDLRDVPLGSPLSHAIPRDYSPWSTPSRRSSRSSQTLHREKEKEKEKSESQDPLEPVSPLSEGPEANEYPTTWKLITILLGVGLSIFLVSLDMVCTLSPA